MLGVARGGDLWLIGGMEYEAKTLDGINYTLEIKGEPLLLVSLHIRGEDFAPDFEDQEILDAIAREDSWNALAWCQVELRVSLKAYPGVSHSAAIGGVSYLEHYNREGSPTLIDALISDTALDLLWEAKGELKRGCEDAIKACQNYRYGGDPR